jgi:OmpA-OmpF porin, OOP family
MPILRLGRFAVNLNIERNPFDEVTGVGHYEVVYAKGDCMFNVDFISRGFLLAVAVFLAACTTVDTRVTLLPQADGKPSAVEVKAAAGTLVLNKPYQVAEVSTKGEVAAAQTTAEDIQKRHKNLLDLAPPAPKRYVLVFAAGGIELTPDSQAQLPAILADASSREGGEIVVTGHTDTVGEATANDALSVQRAAAVKALFVSRGFNAGLIEAVGRGEREPAVPTADDVDEPRNRRVEILVR